MCLRSFKAKEEELELYLDTLVAQGYLAVCSASDLDAREGWYRLVAQPPQPDVFT